MSETQDGQQCTQRTVCNACGESLVHQTALTLAEQERDKEHERRIAAEAELPALVVQELRADLNHMHEQLGMAIARQGSLAAELAAANERAETAEKSHEIYRTGVEVLINNQELELALLRPKMARDAKTFMDIRRWVHTAMNAADPSLAHRKIDELTKVYLDALPVAPVQANVLVLRSMDCPGCGWPHFLGHFDSCACDHCRLALEPAAESTELYVADGGSEPAFEGDPGIEPTLYRRPAAGQGWVTPEQARDSVLRFVNSHFRNRQQGEQARFSIPVDPRRDDDILLMRFITQSEAALTDHDRLVQALEWYAEDDRRAVEMGILESVDKRPARAVLDAVKGQP